MHFPSDSWGKFSKDVSLSMKYYLENGDLVYTPLGEMQEIKAIADELFKPSWNANKTRPEIMKYILEGLRVPVQNLKTGEQDFVDVSLVNKIVIDSDYIEDMKSNDKIKVNFTLSGDQANQQITIAASNKDINLDKAETIPLQKFEEMLFKAVNEVKDQRLEEVEEFKIILNGLMTNFIQDSLLKQKYYAKLGTGYTLMNGIGIIRDIKTNQDVGTFERFLYMYDRNQRLVEMDGIILSGRTIEDLSEKDRFEFAFYSIENGTIYSVIGSNSSNIVVNEDDAALNIKKHDLITEAFGQDHKFYQMAVDAQAYKETLVGIDKSHPLYDTKMQEFRESRLAILEDSRNKQKEEKLVKQFADIDLDFDF